MKALLLAAALAFAAPALADSLLPPARYANVQLPDPRQRLIALLQAERDNESALARYGCPHGSLCQELDKDENQLPTAAAQLFQAYLDWAEQQFRLLGKDEREAKDLALDLIALLQGSLLLAASFRSPELLEQRLQRLQTWLRSV